MVTALTLLLATPAWAELRTETEITYTADVEQGNLRLDSRLVLTNLAPVIREGETTTRVYYEQIQLTVPETVQNLRATSEGRELSYTLRPAAGGEAQRLLVATIDLGGQLDFEETVEIHLEFEVPGDPPRSETTFRINPAYINFGVFGWGDPGLVTVNVVTPATFELELTGSEWDETSTLDGSTIHTVSAIDQPGDFFIHVEGYNDSALVQQAVDIGSIEILVRAWPGDSVWSDQVSSAAAQGLPILMALVGLPWRLEEPLPINESAEVTLAGYGGWYLQAENLIELSEWADPHAVLHELSHVWFNQSLFIGRWINEGLAEVFSGQAVLDAALADPGRLEQAPVDTAGVGPLNNWVSPVEGQLEPEQIRAYEEYGYAASRWVIQEVTDEIGFGAMAEVLAAADANLIAYRGTPPPEQVGAGDDWRRLLDMIEELAGSEVSRDLFPRYVTDEDLTTRYRTRTDYHQLVADGQGWLPPLYVREPMSAWDFEAAAARVTEARTVLESRFEAEATLALLGLNPGSALEEAYQTATETLEEAIVLADRQVKATDTVLAARHALDVERNLLMDVGLLGSDLMAEYRHALDELNQEDFVAAIAEAEEVIMLIEGAEQAGRLHIGLAAGVLAVVVTVAVLARVQRRRRLGPSNQGRRSR